MKYMQRTICLLLAILLLCSLAACQQAPAETTTAPTETTAAPTETTAAPTETTAPEETTEVTEPTEPMTEEEKILWERRQIVIDYMRELTSILWTSDTSFDYAIPVKNENYFSVVAGRVYQGLPYSFGHSAVNSFLEYAVGQDEKGIYSLSGLKAGAFHGNSPEARFGTNCSSAVALAWSQIGASITTLGTRNMCEANGYLPVGDYENEVELNTSTTGVVAKNGAEVMFAAYAQLKPADCVVRLAKPYDSHAMLVEAVHVVYLEDGSIDGFNSYISVLDQTNSYFKKQGHDWNSELGVEVYRIGGLPRKVSFRTLLTKGYLPITCKELRDPSPLPEPEVADTETVFNKDTLLKGTISCNWWIDAVTIIITDSTGTEIQKAAVTAIAYHARTVDMQQFVTEHPDAIRGSIDPAALASGNYHCTVVCRLTTGEEFTVRDFDFTV